MEKKRGVGRSETAEKAPRQVAPLQTLDRGLQALALISRHAPGLSIADLANEMGIHRTIVYRLAATLAAHGLITRGPKGILRLGAGLIALSSRFETQLRETAQPLLQRMANASGATAFISVPQGEDCVAIAVAEPLTTAIHVSYRIGNRHPLTLGAAGIAILAGRAESQSDTEEILQARRDGFIVTRGQLQPGAVGVACPIHQPDGSAPNFEASVGVVTLGDADVEKLKRVALTCVSEMRSVLRNDTE